MRSEIWLNCSSTFRYFVLNQSRVPRAFFHLDLNLDQFPSPGFWEHYNKMMLTSPCFTVFSVVLSSHQIMILSVNQTVHNTVNFKCVCVSLLSPKLFIYHEKVLNKQTKNAWEYWSCLVQLRFRAFIIKMSQDMLHCGTHYTPKTTLEMFYTQILLTHSLQT